MILIASVYTVISLDNANNIVKAGLDKNYEWYASFGIVLKNKTPLMFIYNKIPYILFLEFPWIMVAMFVSRYQTSKP